MSNVAGARRGPRRLAVAGVALAAIIAGAVALSPGVGRRPGAVLESSGSSTPTAAHPVGYTDGAPSTGAHADVAQPDEPGDVRTTVQRSAVASRLVGHPIGRRPPVSAIPAGALTPPEDADPPVDPRDPVGSAIISGRLLFVGASYSVGLGATGRAYSFPDLLAARFHVPFRVDAASGTGFQNPGWHHQGTFAERLVHDPATPAPQIVVIQGGRDDVNFPLDREYGATLDTIDLAQHRFTGARVVLLGPVPARLPISSRLLQVNDAISRAAAAAHAGYINPIAEHWITPANVRSFAGRVPGHPNDAGYAYITSRLLSELRPALAAARAPATTRAPAAARAPAATQAPAKTDQTRVASARP